jgi:signal transduction histidine kinase
MRDESSLAGEKYMTQVKEKYRDPLVCELRAELSCSQLALRAARAVNQNALDVEQTERTGRVEAERLGSVKDAFLANLSHEIRVPLNAILGWAQLLEPGKTSDVDLAHGLEVIVRNARTQARLIDDLLDMSRIISGKMRFEVQRVDLSKVIDAAIESVKPAADAKGVKLEKFTDPIAGSVMGDPDRLQQVIWNLVMNAIKFTPRGGKVQVVMKRMESQIELSVNDTGNGISAAFLPHVFERFSQGDNSTGRGCTGLGLGLAIVRSLTELHGGSVRAMSGGEGKGTTFIVSLPTSTVHILNTGKNLWDAAAQSRDIFPCTPDETGDYQQAKPECFDLVLYGSLSVWHEQPAFSISARV